jgi:hypothetical protein
VTCPDCAPGLAARAAVRDDPDLATTALSVCAPFVVLALVAAYLHHRRPPPPPTAARNPP